MAELRRFVRSERIPALCGKPAVEAFGCARDGGTEIGRSELAGRARWYTRDELAVRIDDAADPAVGQALLTDDVLERVRTHERRHDLGMV